MGVTINKKSATTEPPPKNGQQPKPLGGLNAFYWYQIFALDSAVVEVQEYFLMSSIKVEVKLLKKEFFIHYIIHDCTEIPLLKSENVFR